MHVMLVIIHDIHVVIHVTDHVTDHVKIHARHVPLPATSSSRIDLFRCMSRQILWSITQERK